MTIKKEDFEIVGLEAMKWVIVKKSTNIQMPGTYSSSFEAEQQLDREIAYWKDKEPKV